MKEKTDKATEDDLLRSARGGDHEAFGVLMRGNQDLIFAMIYRQVGDRAVAEDITQDTFIKAYQGLKKFRGESKFSSWLVRIALNQSNSYYRSKKFKQSIMNDPIEKTSLPPDEATAENELISKQKCKQFQIALQKIKPKYRDVLVLCGLEGKSYEEAAEIMEVPTGTIRSRLNKARLLMRESLSKEGVFA